MPLKKSVLVDLVDSDLDHDLAHAELGDDGLLLKSTIVEKKAQQEIVESLKQDVTEEIVTVSKIETIVKEKVPAKNTGTSKNKKIGKR